jgi:hypothetical protein
MRKPKAIRFEIKKSRPVPKEPVERLDTSAVKEELTGFVDGMEASSYEERFARALANNPKVDSFSFREHYFGPARTTPGSIEVDFLVFSGTTTYPIQIDGDFAHGSLVLRDEDAVKDARLNEYFARFGNISKVMRVPDKNMQRMGLLETQDSTNELVGKLFR